MSANFHTCRGICTPTKWNEIEEANSENPPSFTLHVACLLNVFTGTYQHNGYNLQIEDSLTPTGTELRARKP